LQSSANLLIYPPDNHHS